VKIQDLVGNLDIGLVELGNMKIIISESQLKTIITEEDKFLNSDLLPKVFYHGSIYDIEKKNIDVFRTGLDLSAKKTFSTNNSVGLYITPNLDKVNYETTYAKQYANSYGAKKGIVYKVTLSPDIKITTGYDISSINPNFGLYLIAKGIDGVMSHSKDAIVILNKDKIKSFVPYIKWEMEYKLPDEGKTYSLKQINKIMEKRLGNDFKTCDAPFNDYVRFISVDDKQIIDVQKVGEEEWEKVTNPNLLHKISNYFKSFF